MNVQAGDLAVCIKEPNMGCFVKVIERSTDFAVPAWWCRTLQPAVGLAMSDEDGSPMRSYPAGKIMAFADAELRPIRGRGQVGAVTEVIEEAVPA